MFTGIVAEIGTVSALRRRSGGARLTVRCTGLLSRLDLGASVCVSGVCTTVTALGRDSFEADLSPETLKRTTLGDMRPGTRVNLEPALRVGDQIGGHLVAGHVDGVGRVTLWRREGEGVLAEWEVPPDLVPLLAEKGSIAVDGVSLTMHGVTGDRFRASLIPETLRASTLGDLRVGSRSNLEADVLARYAHASGERRGVTAELLARAGFGPG